MIVGNIANQASLQPHRDSDSTTDQPHRAVSPYDRIKLREDLIVAEQGGQDQNTVVVKDPIIDRFFHLGEVEYFIAKRLDGNTPLDSIRRETEQRFKAELDRPTAEQFIRRLWGLGLLEHSDVLPTLTSDGSIRRRMVRGDILYLRIKAFDPDRLLVYLLPLVRFCYSRAFLMASIAILAAGVGIAFSNYELIMWELRGLYQTRTLLIVWGTILLVTAGHEFAHGLTCKYFGGRVREMGFMFLYFQPAMYCNVSDAWLFPEKSRRMWVTFAGAFFELLVWAAGTVLWRITAPGTWVNHISLIVVTAAGIKVFFNFNPLIKLDGYYLLSDYLGIPNLRARAFEYLGGLFGGHDVRSNTILTRRRRRIFLVYGLLSVVYSFAFLGLIASRFGVFLVDRFQGIGFLFFVGLLALMFRNLIAKAVSGLWVGVTDGRQMLRARKRSIIVLTLIAVLLTVGWFVHIPLKIAGEFTILPQDRAVIRSQVEGIIFCIYVNEGDQVKIGDRVAELADGDYRVELASITAEIEEAQANLRLLEAGSTPEEIQLARSQCRTAQTKHQHYLVQLQQAQQVHLEQLTGAQLAIEKAAERLKYARDDSDVLAKLFENHAVSTRELLDAEELVAVRTKEVQEARSRLNALKADGLAELHAAVALAESEIEESQNRLDLLLAGARPEEIQAVQATMQRLEYRRQYLERQITLLRIDSPIVGMVTTPKLGEKVGELVEKGDLIAEIQQVNTVTAEILVSEKDIADIRVDQPIIIKARAYSGRRFNGTVTSIAPVVSRDQEGVRDSRIRVMTSLDNFQGLFKEGMTGHAKIICDDRRILSLMARRLVHYLRVEFWSWW